MVFASIDPIEGRPTAWLERKYNHRLFFTEAHVRNMEIEGLHGVIEGSED